MHTILILNAMRCDAQRADQLRWVASQEEGERKKECQRGRDVAQQDICSAVAISPGNGQSFVASIRSVFVASATRKFLWFLFFFKLLFYFRNLQRSRQIPTTKTLPHIYGSCCCLSVARCVAFIYYTCKEKEAGVGR